MADSGTFLGRIRSLWRRDNPAAVRGETHLSILDVYSAHHDDLGSHKITDQALAIAWEEPPDDLDCVRRFGWRCRQRAMQLVFAPSQWVFLILLGILAAIFGFAIDAVSSWMLSTRIALIPEESVVLGFMWWSIWAILFAVIAVSAGHFITPLAVGSGIPEMKSILSGTPTLAHYLDVKVLVAKVFGVISALGSGLAIGKEGPFVHVACLLAHQLWKLRWFSQATQTSGVTRKQNLAAAVAAGVTAVFGAPVGGVLFSIEVTSTYYLVNNLWRAFLCAIFCVVTFEVINALKEDDLFANTRFVESYRSSIQWELLSFAVLGIVCGLVSSLLVHIISRVMQFKQAMVKNNRARYAYAVAVAFLVALLTFPAHFTRLPYRSVINDMFSSAGGENSMDAWDSPSPFLSLVLFMVVNAIIIPLSLAMSVPCGLFSPLFAFGAVLGRAFGELAAAAAGSDGGVEPGVYAVVGAAALTSGATQTVSTTVIVFELTGQLNHMVAVLLATVLAYSVAGQFSISVYDVLLQVKGLPYLPRAHGRALYHKTAQDLMHRDIRFLTLHDSTFADAVHLLEQKPLSGRYGQSLFEFPVVDSADSMVLVLPLESWVPRALPVDPAPFQIAEFTPLTKVHFLFATCQFAQIFVTVAGKLVGIILKGDLTDPRRLKLAEVQAGSPRRRRRNRTSSGQGSVLV